MLDDMKLKDIAQLMSLVKCHTDDELWQINKAYFIRTVTMHLIGKVVKITKKELLLENAVWVADSGRFHDALKKGELNEVEPFVNDVILNRECIVDATIWHFNIPSSQK